jgi:hypothetical protein
MSTSTLAPGTRSPPRFKTAQVLAWVGLNSQTLRYWKNVLPPIGGRDGRSGGYTLEEIAALAVINRAATQLNVPVSCFAEHAEHLFSAVAEHVTDPAQPHLVFIHTNEVSVGTAQEIPPVDALAIVRIDLVLRDLRDRMTAPAIPPSQFSLFQ